MTLRDFVRFINQFDSIKTFILEEGEVFIVLDNENLKNTSYQYEYACASLKVKDNQVYLYQENDFITLAFKTFQDFANTLWLTEITDFYIERDVLFISVKDISEEEKKGWDNQNCMVENLIF